MEQHAVDVGKREAVVEDVGRDAATRRSASSRRPARTASTASATALMWRAKTVDPVGVRSMDSAVERSPARAWSTAQFGPACRCGARVGPRTPSSPCRSPGSRTGCRPPNQWPVPQARCPEDVSESSCLLRGSPCPSRIRERPEEDLLGQRLGFDPAVTGRRGDRVGAVTFHPREVPRQLGSRRGDERRTCTALGVEGVADRKQVPGPLREFGGPSRTSPERSHRYGDPDDEIVSLLFARPLERGARRCRRRRRCRGHLRSRPMFRAGPPRSARGTRRGGGRGSRRPHRPR